MSIAYITIGAACDTYSDSLPSESGIVLTNGTSVLNSASHSTPGGYTIDTAGSRTAVIFGNYRFDLTTDRDIVLNSGSTVAGTNANANRYLTPSGGAVDTSTVTKRIGVSGGTYSYLGTTYTRNATATAAATTIRNLMSSSVSCITSFSSSTPSVSTISYTTGSTSVGTTGSVGYTYNNGVTNVNASNLPLFYVRVISGDLASPTSITSNTYLKNDSTTTDLQTISDIASTITTGNTYKFFVARFTTNSGTDDETIKLALYDSVTGARMTSFIWNELYKTFKKIGGSAAEAYALDTTNPLDDIDNSQNTLIKTGTNTYLYWNTGYNNTPSSSSISTTSFIANRDYWASGPSSTTELGIRTIFNWFDLTKILNGGYNDVYRWGFLGTHSAYFFYLSGTTPTFSTTVPPANEGWAILYDPAGGNTTGFLVYVRGGNVIGYFDANGTLVTSGNGLPLSQATAHASLNTSVPTAKIYKCAKCSGALTGGLCPAA